MPRSCLRILVLLTLAACQPDGPGRAGPVEPEVRRTPVTFLVLDAASLTGVPGATVLAGDRQGVTDAAGRVTLDLPAGEVHAYAVGEGYDAADVSQPDGGGGGTIQIVLRPSAPLVDGCRLGDGVVEALVTDHSGRKSILRHAHTEVTLEGPAFGSITVPVLQWTWKAVDAWSYAVTVPRPAGDVVLATWRVYDRDLHVRPVSCDPRPTSTEF